VRPIRSAAACGALAALCVVLVACGARARAGATTDRVTKAKAIAYANAVNLRERDVRPWIQREPGRTVVASPALAADARCRGGISPYRWVEFRYSPIFASRLVGAMESTVLVLPTTDLADDDARARLSERGFACFSEAERQLLSAATLTVKGHTDRVGSVEISRLPAPLPGVPGAFEWRVTYTLTRAFPHGAAAIFATNYLDYFGFNAGPAEIMLSTRGYIAPLAKAKELAVLTAVYHRAEAHSL
jgi:hypothetical protein